LLAFTAANPSWHAATSEHLISGKSAMLEFHLVTKLVPTPGAKMPKECPEGSDKLCLAVFGVMYE
jgi:carbonic anhydrase